MKALRLCSVVALFMIFISSLSHGEEVPMTNGNGVNEETCREKSGWLHVGNLCFAPGTVRNIGSAMFPEALIEVKVDGGRAVFRISERIRMTQDQDSMLSMGTSGPARLAHIRSMPVGSNGLQGPVKYGETEFYRFETQGVEFIIRGIRLYGNGRTMVSMSSSFKDMTMSYSYVEVNDEMHILPLLREISIKIKHSEIP